MTADALDPREFERLYREHHPRVLGICRQMLGSPDHAEDAANDVFARLPGALRTYDPAQPFARWLARVAGNYCIDLLRRRRAEQRLLQPADPEGPEPPAPFASPLHELLSREQNDAVRDALFSLPERYLVPLVMRYYSDLGYEEIAKTLGTSRGAIAVLIFRAKQRLRQSLAQQTKKHGSGSQSKTARRAASLDSWMYGPLPAFNTL
ncbi:MAG TPA: sigma-70 family RNA polymerase sigma factor [Terriglobia bacterium]|jgi:RNA polymerase sigma-70 factor (ECF subfamily)|nr:sigma-70 family RNA polymerase sigma factor [Terriglobia bacterium]